MSRVATRKKEKEGNPPPYGWSKWPKTQQGLARMFAAQEAWLRKQHIDAQVLVDADRHKEETDNRVENMKQNRAKNIILLKAERKARSKRSEKLRKQRLQAAAAKKTSLVEQRRLENSQHYSHVKFKQELLFKQKLETEESKYQKISRKYRLKWKEVLPRPSSPQKPISLFTIVDRTNMGTFSPRTRRLKQGRPVTSPLCSYTPTEVNHKSRNRDQVRARKLSYALQHKQLLEEANAARARKQEQRHAQNQRQREALESERRRKLEDSYQKKAFHILEIQSKDEQERAERAMLAKGKVEKCTVRRAMLTEDFEKMIEERKLQAVRAEMKGHILKDEYDEKLWNICRAQAEVMRERIAMAARRRFYIDEKIQSESEYRAKQNENMRQNRTSSASSRREVMLINMREKNELATKAHAERLQDILETIAIEEEMKKLRSENKWQVIEQRIEEMKYRRQLRTNMHMHNCSYRRQYVLNDNAVPLRPALVMNVNQIEEETEPSILTTPVSASLPNN